MQQLRLIFSLLALAFLGACGGGSASPTQPSPTPPPAGLGAYAGNWTSCTARPGSSVYLDAATVWLKIDLALSLEAPRLKEQRRAQIFATDNCTGAPILTDSGGLPLPNKYLGQVSTVFYEPVGRISTADGYADQTHLFEADNTPIPSQALVQLKNGQLQLFLMPKNNDWSDLSLSESYTRIP